MRIYLAGIMQGSRIDAGIGSQSYRDTIRASLQQALPAADLIDPHLLHPNSPHYNDAQAGQTLLELVNTAGAADALIAYLPQASMGTALELWAAHHAGKKVVVVSPLTHNWVIRTCAQVILPDLDSLLEYISSGQLTTLLDGHLTAD